MISYGATIIPLSARLAELALLLSSGPVSGSDASRRLLGIAATERSLREAKKLPVTFYVYISLLRKKLRLLQMTVEQDHRKRYHMRPL